MTRPLPKPGDRIHCDPQRSEGDTPSRWSNPSRCSAIVIAVLDDNGEKLIVFKRWIKHKNHFGYKVMHELWWQYDPTWDLGPLPAEPVHSRAAGRRI